ncbi:MAG: HAMP domain-containing histidine kinase [Patescibacteria group bacterium]|nr:HAMP domain-containing histidine kinase [Patescibacteria group bacterium]
MQIILAIILVIILIYFIKKEIDAKNMAEESFISIVNHTFRTPLTNIKWMSEALSKGMSPEEQKQMSQNLENSTNRLLGIIDTLAGIKDIHNSAAYELKAVSINELVVDSIRRYRIPLNEKKINLSLPTLKDIPLLSIDTKKISFVIQVILENAILYSKENGSVMIYTEIYKNSLILSIEDNGIGLSHKDKRNIFKRFYRGEIAKKMNTDGMGLGLYMSKEIIRRHKGRIKAFSKGVDQGTTFYIILPIKK